jgi:hypothetical protein
MAHLKLHNLYLEKAGRIVGFFEINNTQRYGKTKMNSRGFLGIPRKAAV